MRLFKGILFFGLSSASFVHAQAQTGNGCTTATLSGIYYYLLSGDVLSGNQFYPYVELGKLVTDGQGNVSGNSHASEGGLQSAYTLAGTYSVQSDCTGTLALSVNSQPPSSETFQIVNGGMGAVIAFSMPNAVVTGWAYRQTANPGPIQCSTASLSGSYAYLLTGAVFLPSGGYFYSQAGSATEDGFGTMSVAGMANEDGATFSMAGQGTYAVNSDCSGTASVTSQNGTANYFIAAVEDGQALLFMESDTGNTVAGVALPLLAGSPSPDARQHSPGTGLPNFGRNPSPADMPRGGRTRPTLFGLTGRAVVGETVP